ncbi:hypothetical protein NPIL_296531 [Nephila pilipes]|uniref:Uncharacterized protein n=1 Tax=Nephila pilipes TaxID=299642 RepID=A0A8X6MJV0_NEPPI|nr:hypothetical protein NPIL_296531 [Nephila pilipes]
MSLPQYLELRSITNYILPQIVKTVSHTENRGIFPRRVKFPEKWPPSPGGFLDTGRLNLAPLGLAPAALAYGGALGLGHGAALGLAAPAGLAYGGALGYGLGLGKALIH